MENKKTLQEVIVDILLRIGIPISIIGSTYIVEAVKLGIEKPSILSSITKELYPTIAKLFNTKTANVERAIRHAIDVSWSKERIVILNEIFGLEIYMKFEKPCNSEFIALLSEKIPYLISKSA